MNPFSTLIPTVPSWLRTTMLIAIVLLASISLAQTTPPTPVSVPASRQADRVAIITIEGPIDGITAMSVSRRIAEAEDGGYNAIVFEINSPGGMLGPTFEITHAIKTTSISNTIAWVNHDAHSAASIISIACNEIVSSDPGSFGDAFAIKKTIVTQGQTVRKGIRGMTPDERTKFLPYILAEVTDSARRNGYDEYLVQAIVIDGIELWQIEHNTTGQRFAINEQEYRTIYGEDPSRGMPLIAQVTGGRLTVVTDDAESDSNDTTEQPTPTTDSSDTTRFRPASNTLDDVVREFNDSERELELTLESHTDRPIFTAADKDNYTAIAYITDGSAPIVMRQQQLIDLGFSSGLVANDAELLAFMGATTMDRANESWSEGLVRIMTSMPVRGLLIAIFLIAMFVELITPGTGIGGTVAVLTLIAMIAPPAMIGLAGWWEIIAIIVGLVFLAIEAFVLPGFGVFGILGLISLFAGILWSFIPAGSSLSSPETQQDLLGALVTVMLGSFSAGVVIWLISRNLERLPIFDKFILSAVSGATESGTQSVFSAMSHDDHILRVGETGVATTDLRPAGQADINDKLTDVVAEFGYIEAGTPIRVTSVEAMRIVVDRVNQENA